MDKNSNQIDIKNSNDFAVNESIKNSMIKKIDVEKYLYAALDFLLRPFHHLIN